MVRVWCEKLEGVVLGAGLAARVRAKKQNHTIHSRPSASARGLLHARKILYIST